MKKLLAIAMLVLLLFNMGGYLLFFQYFIARSDSVIDDQINNNHYKNSDLVDIKIPVHLNIQDWSDYEVINGQVNVKGTIYNYAELKMTRDTMYLKCIANQEKSRLVNAKIIYGKQVNDIPTNKQTHIPSVKKNFLDDDYLYTNNKLPAFTNSRLINLWHDHALIKIRNTPIDFEGPPPEACNNLS